MSVLKPEKLHVKVLEDSSETGPVRPRRYTLTHSDLTGDHYLTIGQDFNQPQISGWYTRLMRDEVLGEWRFEGDKESLSLHLYCHVSGGLVLGTARWRYGIFKQHMRLVIEAFRYGDRHLVEARPELDQAEVIVHFKAWQKKYNKIVKWGLFRDYTLNLTKHVLANR